MVVIDYAGLPEFQMRPGIVGKWIASREGGSSNVSILWNTAEPGVVIPHHFHGYEEVILVQEGRIWVELEERSYASPGEVVIIPPNRVHSWGNEGTAPAKVLFIWPVLDPFAPGKSTYLEGVAPKLS
jgi:quercetin dioxygenase-like cupin family protein